MSYNTQLGCSTVDYPQTIGGGYYDTYGGWVPNYVPYWNPPVYIQPTYVPYPVYVPQVGTIVFAPDTELKEEVKGLKEEIKKLRKELAKK